MKKLEQKPFLDGTAISDELTSIGKQIGVYLEYVGKIARVKSEQQAVCKTVKPAGQEVFQKALEREEGQRQKKLNEREKKALEKQTKFDLQPRKIGNPTAMFNAVFHEVTSENKHWQQLIDSAKKEIERLCTQTGAIDKLQNFDATEHL